MDTFDGYDGNQELLDDQALADILRCSRDHVGRLARAGAIPVAYVVGGGASRPRRRYILADVLEALRSPDATERQQ